MVNLLAHELGHVVGLGLIGRLGSGGAYYVAPGLQSDPEALDSCVGAIAVDYATATASLDGGFRAILDHAFTGPNRHDALAVCRLVHALPDPDAGDAAVRGLVRARRLICKAAAEPKWFLELSEEFDALPPGAGIVVDSAKWHWHRMAVEDWTALHGLPPAELLARALSEAVP